MIEERLDFYNKESDFLRGTLYKPDNIHDYPAVIVAHYSQGGVRGCDPYQYLVEILTQIGMAVFVFDRRGQGQSTGNFDDASLEDLAFDLLSAKDTLILRPDVKQIGVWGMSQGGWLVLSAAACSKDISFLINVSGAITTPAEQMLYSTAFALKEKGFTDIEIDEILTLRKLYDNYYRSGAHYSLLQEKLQKVESEAWFPFVYMNSDLPVDFESTKWHKILDFSPTTFMDNIEIPMLVLYGAIDPWIPVRESIVHWQEKDMANLTIHQIEDANHFMLTISESGIDSDTGVVSSQYQQVMVNWLNQQVL